MDNIVIVALITGCVSLSNGVVLAIMNRKWKKKDQCSDEISELKNEIAEVKHDFKKIFKLLDRLGDGLDIGLKNDKVIFKALRKNSINGDSEIQERIMDEYFTQCTFEGFKREKEE